MAKRARIGKWLANFLMTVGLLWTVALTTWFQQAVAAETPASSTAAATTATEPKISPKEAEELFRSVDEILRFASKDTSLPIKHEVKRRLTSRDEVEGYLLKNMQEDKDAQRLRRSELVLKKFGLLPADFDLHAFLPTLLREQVAGYYDPKTQTVNLLDWLSADQQKPVLAHELTHALQDQSFGLEKWMKAGAKDIGEKKDPTPSDIEDDEISETRQAVVEGQAMVTLIDYMLAPYGKTIKDSPEFLEPLKQSMVNGTADSVQFRKAPLFLREALTFPYLYGIDFVADVIQKQGASKAFASMFTDPPHITRQIMEPRTYLSGEKIEPMPLPDFKHLLKSYERFDVGAFGEFDVSILVKQYAGPEASRKLYPEWRGGYYYAAHPKGALVTPLSLVYVSRWSSADHAAEFAAVYAKALPTRYKKAEAKSAPDGTVVDLKTIQSLPGTHIWDTEDGPVIITVNRDLVMITEGLDASTTEQLAHTLFSAPLVAKN